MRRKIDNKSQTGLYMSQVIGCLISSAHHYNSHQQHQLSAMVCQTEIWLKFHVNYCSLTPITQINYVIFENKSNMPFN